jgi:hypothetical protein
MRKLFVVIVISLLTFTSSISQETTENQQRVKFGGYVGYEAIYDTYKSVDTRDGELYFYPRRAVIDENGKDINKIGQLTMLSIQTRLWTSIQGPDAFGAKTSGHVEADFFSTAQAYTRHLRVRHAYIRLNWEKSELLMGEYWHPTIVTSCIPTPLAFGAGALFHPLNRSAQVRWTYSFTDKFRVLGAALLHGYHKSVGPAEAQRNSGLPDAQFQLQLGDGKDFITGFTAGYKFMKPSLFTTAGTPPVQFKNDEILGSYNLQAFLKYSFTGLTIKTHVNYGQNLTHFLTIGGYGMETGSLDPATGHFRYTNINTLTSFLDIQNNSKVFNYGIFAALAQNTGSDKPYTSLGKDFTRDGAEGDIFQVYRISPRLMWTSGKVNLGLEYMLTGIVYMDIKEGYKPDKKDDALYNNRFIFLAKYTF